MIPTVRIPPSPTGYLQVGNGRMAILNALFAKKTGAKVLLRIDDTDDTRSTKEFEAAILEDYAWLGIRHDIFARQSDRGTIYEAAAEKLKAAGRLYPAYETADELDRRRKRQMAAHKPPLYDRAALNLAAEDRARLEAEGRRPHWRFKLSHAPVRWNDLIRGPVEIDTATLSDPVLIREDGRFLYTLPSVVDDIDFAITHIIRGEDHVTNTAPQIEIFEALAATADKGTATLPAFAHYPLFVLPGGEVLSKRKGSLSLRGLREEGIEALALASYLAKIGTSDPIEPRTSLDALAADFDLAKISRAAAHFDVTELEALNAKVLHILPYETVQPRLVALGADRGPQFWEALRPNLPKLEMITTWRDVIFGPHAGRIYDAELTTRAAELLPPEPWDENTWGIWTKTVSAATGKKGRDLFRPLRAALTFLDHGPEMKKLLPLIGRAKAFARLKGETA
ncbi:MAG TPA: glutamate--tRNA ligase [Rhizomicrobium sp.]